MYRSQVKWFSTEKGYGFIKDPEGGEKDIFVHFSQINNDNDEFRTLEDGQEVTFDIGTGPKGDHATNVQPV